MGTFTQANRPMKVKTPLGDDVMLLAGFTGHEAISQLFRYELELLVENTKKGLRPVPRAVQLDSLLGQSITIELAMAAGKRFFNGLCSRISQGAMDETFTTYRMEVVPKAWLLTRRARCCIFQPADSSVPTILKTVLKDIEIDDKIQGKDKFYPRDYCVQYRETDFNFAARLMEEEGIYFYFRHEDGKHTMVLANTPQGHADVPGPTKITYETMLGGNRPDDRIFDWSKRQELRSGKYTLWDYTFEKPDSHLEASADIQASVEAGEVTHQLKVANNGQLELYDYPGEYAQRFDGIDKGGGEKPQDVQKIFEDNKRTVGIRMQEEGAASLLIQGAANSRHLVAGCKFTLADHVNANGDYVLTAVTHAARVSDYHSEGEGFSYSNTFQCIPFALPFRPARVTPKPLIPGTQTAVVVGPAGEEIFTDKYSRVKVQFHWDREGKKDAGSSCWIRVATLWAGRRWGMTHVPRIGQEVIVDFLEGDPDQPIIVGSVYNADQMPPYLGRGPDSKHPHNPRLSGIKSNSTPGGVGFNELRFDDTKAAEQIFLHAERNVDIRVKNDEMERVLNNRHLIVGAEKEGNKTGDQREMVYQDKHQNVKRNHVESIEGNMELLVGGRDDGGNQDIIIKKDKRELIVGNSHQHVKEARSELVDKDESLIVGGARKELIKGHDHLKVKGNRNEQIGASHSESVGGDHLTAVTGDAHHQVKGNRNEKVGGDLSLTVVGSQQAKVGSKHALEAGQEIHLKSGQKVVIEAGAQLTLQGPGGFITIDAGGVTIQGTMVKINSGGAAGSGSGASPTAPKDPAPAEEAKEPMDAKEAKPRAPDEADDAKTGSKSSPQ